MDRKAVRTARWAATSGGVYDALLRRVGENLARLRKERGESQEACAHLCGVGLLLWQRLERGKTNFTAATIARVAHGLNVDVVELLAPAGAFTELKHLHQEMKVASKTHHLRMPKAKRPKPRRSR